MHNSAKLQSTFTLEQQVCLKTAIINTHHHHLVLLILI